jgi:hypothetical protein
MELDLEFGDLPEEQRVALRRTIEEALSILEMEETRQQAEKPAGSIARSGERIYRKTLSSALLLTRAGRFLISRTLWLSAMVFLVHFSRCWRGLMRCWNGRKQLPSTPWFYPWSPWCCPS